MRMACSAGSEAMPAMSELDMPTGLTGSAVRTPAMAILVFFSGCCALVYQIGWLRELRLVFGASTYASSVVLSIFMGGLGLGGLVLGRVADRHTRPLKLYALLELGIGASALFSPVLLALTRKVYLASGGVAMLGQPLSILVRVLLSCAVLGLPAFLMGGTLPAAVREVETAADVGRRKVALLYGVNTLGAVVGVMAATFFLLENLGTRATIVSAAILNIAVGVAALALQQRGAYSQAKRAGASAAGFPALCREVAGAAASVAPFFVLCAAAIAGFIFFLMEIVWYRMLSPLLGGTTYTFGLILAVALLGIGTGGLLYAFHKDRIHPTARLLALTCALEAFGVALAYGLGDRVAVLALFLRPAAGAGLAAYTAGWILVSAIVVFPAAFVSGYQFPLLLGLLGRGRRRVGSDTGAVYGWNTLGAVAGALAGGFGLLPVWGAVASWRLAVLLLGALCAGALALSLRTQGWGRDLALPIGALGVAIALLTADGPTAAWRHKPVGAGGVSLPGTTGIDIRNWLNASRFSVIWEKDGLESSVGITRSDGLAFVINGKVDGNVRGDAGTQVMGPLVGAILHPRPATSLVVGLGTGSSAGWLSAIPSMERVDVVELEPAVLEVARRSAPVNQAVLSNPKVRVISGDAREVLMTSRGRYDLIFSEPSNPYRAGIASLYTLEFYQSVAARLAPGGIFSQWVQAYSVSPETVALIAATLSSVFGDVEAWRTTPGDLLFVCAAGPKSYSLPALAQRVSEEPYRSAMFAGWGVAGLEGFLAGFLANDRYAKTVAQRLELEGLNTDDKTPVEFGFARALGTNAFSLTALRQEVRSFGADRPAVSDGEVDWSKVGLNRLVHLAWQSPAWVDQGEAAAEVVYRAYLAGDLDTVPQGWLRGWWKPSTLLETAMLAEALADRGDRRALPLLPGIAAVWPATADVIAARLLLRAGDPERAFDALRRAMAGFAADPWNPMPVMGRSLALGIEMATAHPQFAGMVFGLFETPFSVRLFDNDRMIALVGVAALLDCSFGERALAQIEPHVPFSDKLLHFRAECYAQRGNPLAKQAREDLAWYLEQRRRVPDHRKQPGRSR